MGRELAPAGDISPNANCGELIRAWQCTDHVCIMIDPYIFDDKIDSYGRLLATLCVQWFVEPLTKGGDLDAMYSSVINDLQNNLAHELSPRCPATKLEPATKREELPLPACALKDPTNTEIVRAWLYNPFGDAETEFSIVPQDKTARISELLLQIVSEVSVILTRDAGQFDSIRYKLARFFSGKRGSVQWFI